MAPGIGLSTKSSKVSTPSTRFGKVVDVQDGVDSSSVDWKLVTRREPDKVCQWMHYLHRRAHPQVRVLLRELLSQQPHTAHGQYSLQNSGWFFLMRSDLPCILMDIVSEPGMFSDRDDAFKCVTYSVDVLVMLDHFLVMDMVSITLSSERGQRSKASVKRDRDVLSKMDRFCNVMWDNRHLVPIPLRRDGSRSKQSRQSSSRFHEHATLAILALTELYGKTFTRAPPVSSHAIHFLIYSWTYLSPSDHYSPTIMAIANMAQDGSLEGEANGVFEELVTTCRDDYVEHLTEKLSRVLADDGLDETEVHAAALWCAYLITGLMEREEIDTRVSDVALSSLIPSALGCCQRRMCTTTSRKGQETVMSLLRIVYFVLSLLQHDDDRNDGGASLTRQSIQTAFGEAATTLNVTAIVAYGLTLHLTPKPIQVQLHTTAGLLDILYMFARHFLDHEAEYSKEITHLKQTGTGIWHDTMKAMSAIRVDEHNDPVLVSLKADALSIWQSYGDLFGWKMGTIVKSMTDTPSTPNDASVYWKIPRRCFSNACACSAHPPFHRVLVCKGCWRVLYCSKKCQRADWVAGHRRVCKTYWK